MSAIQDVKLDFDVDMNVTIVESDCAPATTLNKASKIVGRGRKNPESAPIAMVGFTCDEEHKTFGDGLLNVSDY